MNIKLVMTLLTPPRNKIHITYIDIMKLKKLIINYL